MPVVSQESQKHWHLKLWVSVSIRHGSVHFRVEDLRRRVEREAAQWRPWGLCCLHIRAPEEARPDRSLCRLFRWGPDLLLSSHSHISRFPGLSLLNLELWFWEDKEIWNLGFFFDLFGCLLLVFDGFIRIWFDRAYGIVFGAFSFDLWFLKIAIDYCKKLNEIIVLHGK